MKEPLKSSLAGQGFAVEGVWVHYHNMYYYYLILKGDWFTLVIPFSGKRGLVKDENGNIERTQKDELNN